MQIESVQFTPAQREQFQTQGFLVVDRLLSDAIADTIRERIDPLFLTQFETGIYPDEWYGRPGLSQPNATRHMTGLWRCDRTIASLSLSADIARLNATLMGWDGGRYGLDSCWIKPPDAPAVYFHRNNTYASCLDPSALMTCWIALSEASADNGTLEVVPGSHHWPGRDRIRFLHAPKEDYRTPMWQAARDAGVENPEVMPIEIPKGAAVFLHGDLWHGSGRNPASDQTRCAFSISTLPLTVQFQPLGVGEGYIFSRYRPMDRLELDESFYPILWSTQGDRTPMVDDYVKDAQTV